VLYYTRISRHVSANSKPSSCVVAYIILKVSNHIKNSNGSIESALNIFLAIAVVNEVKTNISLAGLPVLEYYVDNTRHQTTVLYLTSLHFIINFTFIILSSSSSCFSFIFASDIFVLT
jgi:hypothetical protein